MYKPLIMFSLKQILTVTVEISSTGPVYEQIGVTIGLVLDIE